MTTSDDCGFSSPIDAHFEGALSPKDVRAMFEHVRACAACKTRYERMMILETLEPEALGPKERLRRALPFPVRRPRWVVTTVGALALAAAAMLVVGRLGGQEGFRTRGASEARTVTSLSGHRIEVFRMSAGNRPARLEGTLGQHDELAFAYENPSGKKRLLIFAADEHRRVYWYYPAWANVDETPEAVPVARSSNLVELGEAVRQDIDASRVMLYAVFTDAPLTVRDVEARVAASDVLAPALGFPEAIETSRALEVR